MYRLFFVELCSQFTKTLISRLQQLQQDFLTTSLFPTPSQYVNKSSVISDGEPW